MKTHFIEVTQGSEFNWGKFMLGEWTEEEWVTLSALPGYEHTLLLPGRGWSTNHFLILDIQTGEGAIFAKGSRLPIDLNTKHQIWVCPMYEPFLVWLADQKFDSVTDLPRYVKLETDVSGMGGYRRERRG